MVSALTRVELGHRKDAELGGLLTHVHDVAGVGEVEQRVVVQKQVFESLDAVFLRGFLIRLEQSGLRFVALEGDETVGEVGEFDRKRVFNVRNAVLVELRYRLTRRKEERDADGMNVAERAGRDVRHLRNVRSDLFEHVDRPFAVQSGIVEFGVVDAEHMGDALVEENDVGVKVGVRNDRPEEEIQFPLDGERISHRLYPPLAVEIDVFEVLDRADDARVEERLTAGEHPAAGEVVVAAAGGDFVDDLILRRGTAVKRDGIPVDTEDLLEIALPVVERVAEDLAGFLLLGREVDRVTDVGERLAFGIVPCRKFVNVFVDLVFLGRFGRDAGLGVLRTAPFALIAGSESRPDHEGSENKR